MIGPVNDNDLDDRGKLDPPMPFSTKNGISLYYDVAGEAAGSSV